MAKAQAKYTITAEDKTRRGVNSAKKGLDGLKASAVGFAARAAGAIGGLLATLGVLGVKLNQTAERLNRLNRMGQDVGLVGAQTAQLGFLAERKDLSPEQLVGGLEMIAEKVEDAAIGGMEARRQFAALGLSFQDLQGKSPVQQLLLIEKALSKIADAGRRVAAVSELMGGGFGRLFAGAPISDVLRRAQQLGVTTDASRRQAAGTAFEQGQQSLAAAIGARMEKIFLPAMNAIAVFMERSATRVAGGDVAPGGIGQAIQRQQLVELQRIRQAQGRAAGQAPATYAD